MSQAKVKLDAQREKQVREAEELLFAGPQKLGLAKGLFLGRFAADWVMPYPALPPKEADTTERAVTEVRQFLDESLDHQRRRVNGGGLQGGVDDAVDGHSRRDLD